MKKWLLIWSLAALFAACSEEDFEPSILSTTTEEGMTALDQWIYENYTKPYNIEILYRWDDFESDPNYNLVPPYEDRVEPFLRVLRKVWIEPYLEVAGEDFFAELCPKQIMLVGSAGYNSDGTYLLGQAEAGNKITMFNINLDDPAEENTMTLFTHNFHHEFSHILHQTIEYPEAFALISANEYTESWTSLSNYLNLGFVSLYAAADADEDFAEMFATFLRVDDEMWNNYMNAADNQEARDKVQEKATLMLNYMQSSWGIDMYELREKVHAGMEAVLLGNY